MKRKASAVWQGNLKGGKGTVSSESTVLNNTPYSFTSRFAAGTGTNPEELIAAAHAGCFTFENHPQTSWTITSIHLTTVGKVPGIAAARFSEIAAGAKANCPVSRALKAEITLDAKLG
jgi:osmotically inducible protein OsmC